MGINVVHETESAAEIAGIEDSEHGFSQFLLHADIANTVCLKFIDPFGDTIFNQKQIPILADELSRLITLANNDKEAILLKAIAELVKSSIDQVHTYIRFVGD
jgi:hypothetical protein